MPEKAERPSAHQASRALMALAALTVVTIAATCLGLLLAGASFEIYFEFPPTQLYVEHAPFSAAVFAEYAVVVVLLLAVFSALYAGWRPKTPQQHRPLPGWAAAGLALLMFSWFSLWSGPRFVPIAGPLKFFGLWLGFIVALNGLSIVRFGISPLTARPLLYLALFPLSAGFWWYFEYLNRFVQNWHYPQSAAYSALEYFLYASLDFSTVLPAVFAAKAFIGGVSEAGSTRGAAVPPAHANRPALAAGIAMFVFLPVFPNLLFAALWVAPLLVLSPLQQYFRVPHLFQRAAVPDVREPLMWAAAGLLCGFFWEFWNYWSETKWVYLIPYVDALRLFEMPILGYAGYLPFGVFCGAVVQPFISRAAAAPRSESSIPPPAKSTDTPRSPRPPVFMSDT